MFTLYFCVTNAPQMFEEWWPDGGQMVGDVLALVFSLNKTCRDITLSVLFLILENSCPLFCGRIKVDLFTTDRRNIFNKQHNAC